VPSRQRGMEPHFVALLSLRGTSGSTIENFLEPICRSNKRNNNMVRHRATFWNHLFDSLLKVNAKLTKLGFVYRDGKVTVRGLEVDS
jgi:hypothetical protein